jgi:hypothetical protein
MPMEIETGEDIPVELPTEPETERDWWDRLHPLRKTQLGMSGNDEELTIENLTPETWRIHHNYAYLGVVDPQESRTFLLAKRGVISAQQLEALVGTDYLVVPITGWVHIVRIYIRALPGQVVTYHMEALGQ